MKVLITGATGYIGAWTAKAVQDHGHDVRHLARNPVKLRSMAATVGFDDSDVVVGDMTDAGSVAEALNGCDAVIHAAAVVSLTTDGTDYMIEANLRGAKNVVGGAVDRGLDPIVFVSSSATLWHRRCPQVHAGLPPCGGGDGYADSKVRIEHYLRELQEGGAPIAVTYPCTVIGPAASDQYGESGQALGSFLVSGVLGRGTGLTICDVRDVAEAHARLIVSGRGPRRYVLGGHHLTGDELAAELSRITGRRVRRLRVPDGLLVAAGKLADRYRHRLPPALSKLSEAGARYLTDAPAADNLPAEQDLGITFRPAQVALQALLTDLGHTRDAR